MRISLLLRCSANCAFTHIEVSDVKVVFPELLQPDWEALHETAALVVARGTAVHGGEEESQKDLDGQEE